MKNTIAVTVGLKFRFHDFEPGQLIHCDGKAYMKTTDGKYPAICLEDGSMVHWQAAGAMEWGLYNLGSTIRLTIAQKPKVRVRNVYQRVKRVTAAL